MRFTLVLNQADIKTSGIGYSLIVSNLNTKAAISFAIQHRPSLHVALYQNNRPPFPQVLHQADINTSVLTNNTNLNTKAVPSSAFQPRAITSTISVLNRPV